VFNSSAASRSDLPVLLVRHEGKETRTPTVTMVVVVASALPLYTNI